MLKSLRLLCSILLLGLSACASLGIAAGGPALSSAPPAPASSTPPSGLQAFLPSPTEVESPTPAIAELKNETIRAQIDKLAAWFMAQGRNPGLGVAVVMRDPHTGQLQAMLLNYGTIGKGNAQGITSNTEYEIGSITKVFTGVLLAEAVRSGAVQLQDPIQKYLPAGVQAPTYKNQPIKLVDLATHRSGLPRDLDTDSLPGMYDWLNAVQLGRAPGSEYVYSNAGYSLLGDILARLAGTDFDTLEFESVSRPLGLIDTRETLTADQTTRLAQGYTYDGSPASDFPETGAMSSAGYMRSTLNDMTRFLIANMELSSSALDDSLALTQAVQAAGKSASTGVGLGWEIDQLGTSGERLSKGGGTYGFTSYISFRRDRSYGFVLLSNGMYVENLVPDMLRILNAAR